MIVDAHLHCTGRERPDEVLRALDEAGIDVAVLLAPFLGDGYSMHDAASLVRGNDHLAALVRGHTDRLVGLAVVNAALPGAVDETERVLDDLGLAGLKMVPSGWRPEEACAQAVFAVAAARKAPILFHSGIFVDGRSSRFCRPADYEPVRAHRALRVTLAQLGWPWCDEANAVGLIDRQNGVPPDASAFRFDLSFGAPPIYRIPMLRNALAVLGPELLQFGSGCSLPCAGKDIAERVRVLHGLLDELDVDGASRQRIFAGTAEAWLRLPSAVRAADPAAAPA